MDIIQYEQNRLLNIEAAVKLLAEARDIREVTEIRNYAEAVRLVARQAKAGLQAQNEAAELKLRAERRAGEMLAAIERVPREKNFLDYRVDLGKTYTETIKDVEINQKTAHNWQRIASIPKPEFEQHLQETKQAERELTSAGAVRLAKERERISRMQQRTPTPSPGKAAGLPAIYIASADNLPLDNEIIDLIITSPPYNLGCDHWPMGGNGRTARASGVGYNDDYDETEYQAWQIVCIDEMFRVAKPGCSLFYNHKPRTLNGALIHPLDWLRQTKWIIRQEIIWDRGSTHNHSAQLFWPEDERIYWLTKGKPVLPDRPIGVSSVWREFGPIPDQSWHPAPFTERLPEMIMTAIGRDGITVLDPFAGSCTTIRVALRYGFNAIAIDQSEEYLTRAIEENGWIITSTI